MRTRPLLALVCLAFVSLASAASLQPARLRCEYLENPVGIDAAAPRLSWIVTSTERGARQTAYRIVVGPDEASVRAGRGQLWDSGKVASDATAQILYAGKPLGSAERAYWAVQTWDENDQPSAWSAPAFWEMGLLTLEDPSVFRAAGWHAKWIARTPSSPQTLAGDQPLPLFRRAFGLIGKVKRARVYVIGLGYFELTINGQRIGNSLLDPGFTRYDRRMLYVTHDVTDALRTGGNVLGVMLGNGWFNVHAKAAWNFDQAPWRATPRLLLELRVEFDNGGVFTLVSDESWKTADGPITFSSLYGGENYDARRERADWNAVNYNDDNWQRAVVVDAPKGKIVAQAHHPVRVTKRIRPIAVTEPEAGVFVVDAGQNLTGNAELHLSAPAGTTLAMRYTEKLNAAGRADQANIAEHVVRFDQSQQFQTDIYTFKGQGTERGSSRFTYHGFRYIEVTGAPRRLTPDDFTINFYHADVPEVGAFESSSAVLNRIWTNGRWSYLSNLFAFPTDCPHREKNGWTGDAHIACAQGLLYQDGITIYEKWLRDLADEQFITGALPGIVPTSGQWGYGFGSGPSWDSVFLMIPWYLYEFYGDTTALKQHYDGAKKYVDYLTTRAKDRIVGIGLGDWSPWKTKAPREVTDTGYYYRDARIVASVAKMLGKDADAKRYNDLADAIRTAFNRTFYKPETGTYADGSQTALACALFQGLVEPANQKRVADNLVAAIAKNDNHLDFGFLGSKYVPNALTSAGHADLAYTLITNPAAPSYAAQIAQGATTLWENWDGSGSQNHTFFGDVNAWMVRRIAGIDQDLSGPGFHKIIIRPTPVGDLTWAKASYDSLRGKIASAWKREASGKFELAITIPANSTATVHLPATDAAKITESGAPLANAKHVKLLKTESGRAILEVGSGSYSFVVAP